MADMFGDTLRDAAAERSRATMWDVPRFAERHAYRAIVVENVVEAAKWVGWRGWLTTMTDLGYDHQLVSLNSMHAQAIDAPRAPQSRDRLYIVFDSSEKYTARLKQLREEQKRIIKSGNATFCDTPWTVAGSAART